MLCTFLWESLFDDFRAVFMPVGMHTTHYKTMTFSHKTNQRKTFETAISTRCSRYFWTELDISPILNGISSIQASLGLRDRVSRLPHYWHKLWSLLLTPQPGKIRPVHTLSRAWWGTTKGDTHLVRGWHRSLLSQELLSSSHCSE